MDIVNEALVALRSEGRVMLATIVSTSGSTPASAFSKMLLKEKCSVSLGTVGGGCVEGDVLREARLLYEKDRAAILTFHLTEDHLESGMLCGGSLDVLIEPLTAEQIPVLERLVSMRDDGEDAVVATYLGKERVVHRKALFKSAEETAILAREIGLELDEEVRKVFQWMETRRIPLAEGEVVLEPVAGLPGLFIFGGGHVSRYVCRAATMAGFRVTVVDDRPEFANPQRFPEAVRTLAAEFSSAFEHVSIGRSSFVVIVTRGHRSDEEVLDQAVRTPARYIGMIGSKRKVLQTFKNLQERGVDAEKLSVVHAPIGIDIGASTAEEIGVSIVAELIYARRGGGRPLRAKSDVMKSEAEG